MTSVSKSFTALALVLPVLMFAGQAKAEMTGDEIKAAVSGKTFDFTGEHEGTATFSADGSATTTLKVGTKLSGKWDVEDNKFCTHWDGQDRGCASWTDEGGKYVSSTGYTMTPQ